MAVKFSTTMQENYYVRLLVFGQSGAGKTTLIKTAPKPVVITSENKLLALKDQDIKVFVIETAQDLDEVYSFLISNSCKDFETVCFDSLSDIAEKVLSIEKVGVNDVRQAYGKYVDLLLPRIERLASIPNKNVYMICHEERIEDSFTGISTYGPSMPGRQLGPKLPYKFDYVLALRIGETEEGKKFHYLQTTSDLHYSVKGDQNKLDPMEEPNLTKLFGKLVGKKAEVIFEKLVEPKHEPKTEQKPKPKPKAKKEEQKEEQKAGNLSGFSNVFAKSEEKEIKEADFNKAFVVEDIKH